RVGNVVSEVAGGCFCCRFTDLVDAVRRGLEADPDLLLCEPVGSCTDLVATVVQPFQQFYGDRFRMAPLSVLLDPAHVRQWLLHESDPGFPEEVAYIWEKQVAEADLLVLNKVDTLSPEEQERLLQALQSRCSDRRVIGLSALGGQGVE